mmetsp:Transcript_23556/g.42521  ORF Transcript_23556/g.42521 Transcript_23556/m.42521 type:complete len:132 (-) Transcript_23556:452-847(-)
MVRSSAAAALMAAGLVAPTSAFVAPSSVSVGKQSVSYNLRATAGPSAAPASSGFAAAAAGLGVAGLAAAATTGQRKSRKAGTIVKLNASVGDAIPDIGLDEGFPPEKVMLGDYCKGKKVVLVGLPGAFTPT